MKTYSDQVSTFIQDHLPTERSITDHEMYLIAQKAGYRSNYMMNDSTEEMFGLKVWGPPDGDPNQRADRAEHFFVHWSTEVDIPNNQVVYQAQLSARTQGEGFALQVLFGMTEAAREVLGLEKLVFAFPEKVIKNPVKPEFMFESEAQSELAQAILTLQKSMSSEKRELKRLRRYRKLYPS